MLNRDDSVAVVIALSVALAMIVLAVVTAVPFAERSARAADPLATCAEWTDDCVVCQRPAGGGEANCSMPGIACTRGPARCLRPL